MTHVMNTWILRCCLKCPWVPNWLIYQSMSIAHGRQRQSHRGITLLSKSIHANPMVWDSLKMIVKHEQLSSKSKSRVLKLNLWCHQVWSLELLHCQWTEKDVIDDTESTQGNILSIRAHFLFQSWQHFSRIKANLDINKEKKISTGSKNSISH